MNRIELMKFKVQGTLLDRRRKLTEEEKEEIRLNGKGKESYRKIGLRYGVSGSTIEHILHPERLLKKAQQFQKRRRDGRYNLTKEQAKQSQINHYIYKQTINQ